MSRVRGGRGGKLEGAGGRYTQTILKMLILASIQAKLPTSTGVYIYMDNYRQRSKGAIMTARDRGGRHGLIT